MTQKNSSLHSDKSKDRKDGITRASDTFITMMIGALVLLLWFHPSAFDKFWSELQKIIKPAAALVEFLRTQPLVTSALQALPSIASTFVLLLFVLVLMFEHVRLAAPPPGVAKGRCASPSAQSYPLVLSSIGTGGRKCARHFSRHTSAARRRLRSVTSGPHRALCRDPGCSVGYFGAV